ncbi:unnamed protein product [Prorocentrum cordatum]|uniref:Uncharacterized protein n=1 Tax=Prorocentrum cordatum TaxID=2364126 RepID=A0ABN9T023_9DINO|nr:unnamed protein product [Polarella glacialis]
MPLELVTSRRDEKTLQKVRSVCCSPEASMLAGLMAHLTYWQTLAHARGEGRSRLTDRAMQTMIASAKEFWQSFEEEHRDTPTGVSLVLPCLMLAVKVGMLHCFETQYPKICQDQDLAQQLVDRINAVVMRLLDRDNVYPRFGRVDCTGEATALARKVEHFQNPRGCAGASRRFAGGVKALSQPVQNALKSSADAPRPPPCPEPQPLRAGGLPPLGSARG